MVVQGQLVDPPFALVIYKACKELIHSLSDRSQITSCLNSKFFLIFMNQKFQFMIFTLANGHFIV